LVAFCQKFADEPKVHLTQLVTCYLSLPSCLDNLQWVDFRFHPIHHHYMMTYSHYCPVRKTGVHKVHIQHCTIQYS